MMGISTYKKLALFAVLLFGSLGVFGIFAPQAEAVVTNRFPRAGEGWVLLSKYNCPGHCLETPSASFRVFYDTKKPSFNNNNFSVTVSVICRGGTSKPGGGMKFGTNSRKDWNHCNGALSTSPNYSISQTAGKGQMKNAKGKNLTDQYRYIDLDVRVGNSSADIIAIIVTANHGGMVTFEEVPRELLNNGFSGNSNNYTGRGSGSQKGPYPIGTAFAMFENLGGSYDRDFKLEFAADCNVKGSQNVKLRWYDADQNTGTNPHNLRFDLYERKKGGGGGSYIRQNYSSNLGGNDSYRHITIKVKEDHQYIWRWKGVSNINGIQIWMPFNEFTSNITCDKPPTGNLNLACNKNNGIRVRNIKDPDAPHADKRTSIRVRVRHPSLGNNANGDPVWRVVYNSEASGSSRVSGNRPFPWPNNFPKAKNNRVELVVRNITPSGDVNNDGARIITKTINCDGGNDCPAGNCAITCDSVRFRVGSGGTLPNGRAGPDNRRYAIWVNDGSSPGDPPVNYQTGQKYSPDVWSLNGRDVAGTAQSISGPGEQVVYNIKAENKIKSGNLRVTYVVFSNYNVLEGPRKGETWRHVWDRTSRTVKCYTAECTVDIEENVDGAPDGSNAVMANQPFDITVTLTNKGDNVWKSGAGLWNRDGSEYWNGNYFRPYTSHEDSEIWVDESVEFNATLWAPNDQNIHHFRYLAYTYHISEMVNVALGGLDCYAPIKTYKEFNIEPSANRIEFRYNNIEDAEDPNRVLFHRTLSNTATNPATVSVQVTRDIQRNETSIPPFPATNAYSLGSNNQPDEAGISNVQYADEYCGYVTVSPAAGWQGPPGQPLYITDHSASDSACEYIANHPYLRAYGADVSAGSNFMIGEVCNPTVSSIRTFSSNRPDKSGGGAQLAAIAMGQIESFRTASLRSSPPTAPKGLNFGPDGDYKGLPLCATDFFGETQSDDPSKKNVVNSGSLNPNSPPNLEQTLHNGNMVLGGATNFNRKKVIYVDGDVRIDNNITFAGFSSPTNAPSFALVVRGNIYINREVSILSGLYIAQQRADGSGGTIYTCARPSAFEQYRPGPTNEVGQNELIDNCMQNRQLTVNGAFIAHDVEFLRLYESVRNSLADQLERAGNTKAAEVFNFSPEMYLSPPPFARDASTSGKFQFYTTLPPIL